MRTDLVDGFLCDRGFQVLNPSYPAVRRWVDLDALALQSFGAGVMVRRGDGLRLIANPVREPRLIARTLGSGYLRPDELAALARWSARVLVDPQAVMRQPDTTLAESLDAAGVVGRLRREVLDPFLAGVLVERHGASSANFAKLLVRMFALGRPGLPRQGMGALPAQLAARLPQVRLGVPVEAVSAEGRPSVSVVAGGSKIAARAVVVATDPVTAARLTALPEPATKGLVTWWFEAPQAPSTLPMLAVDGRRSGAKAPAPCGTPWSSPRRPLPTPHPGATSSRRPACSIDQMATHPRLTCCDMSRRSMAAASQGGEPSSGTAYPSPCR